MHQRHDEGRGHTLANELNSRNINSTGPAEYEPEYDGAGHLVDDTENYAYVWDAFGRLRQVKETGTGDLVAEYTYNGLGYRIGWHYDADVDGDVDGSDPWYRFVYDERWRIVATYRGSDSDPKEQFVHHAAGDSGYGTASYIDDVILRDRDDNSGWTSSADGTLEERIYHCQSWRHDVVALVDGNGAQTEMARYSPYGVPFGLPAGDLDSDGDVDAADLTVFDALVAYDVRADLDLDGDYDVTDRSTINANRGTSAGLGVLSQSGVASRKGYAGYTFAPELQDARRVYHVRHRVLDADLGRWMSRDRFGYIDGPNQLAYIKSRPIGMWDPFGLATCDKQLLRTTPCLDPIGDLDCILGCTVRYAGDPYRLSSCINACLGLIPRNNCGPDATADFYPLLRFNCSQVLFDPLGFGIRSIPRGQWDYARRMPKTTCARGSIDIECPSGDCRRSVSLCGICMPPDVLGNINFGFAGRCAGWSLRDLLNLSGGAALLGEGTEQPCDASAIAFGYAMGGIQNLAFGYDSSVFCTSMRGTSVAWTCSRPECLECPCDEDVPAWEF